MRQNLEERRKQLTDAIDQLIRDFARSELLDQDLEKSERLAERKNYLKEQRAINVGLLDDHHKAD